MDSLFLLLAHGADPRPISWDEATANLVKFFVTILLAVLMSYPVLAPLFTGEGEETEGEGEEQKPASPTENNSGLLGWVGLGLLLMLSMAWWLTRTSIVELTAAVDPTPEHAHTQEKGGQVAMWGDFHAEVSRIESGEVRVYLTDSYNRPIAARFFDAEITPFAPDSEAAPAPTEGSAEASATPVAVATPNQPPSQPEEAPTASAVVPHSTMPALNDSYRFARLGQERKAYRVKVKTPGWSVTLKFVFDGENGRRSLPIWCGTP